MDRKNRMMAADFQRVMRGKRSEQVRAKRNSLFVIVAKTDEPTKVGFITSAKKVGNAVARNTIRRRLRVIARELVEQYPAGYSVVIMAETGVGDQSLDSLREAIFGTTARAQRR